MIRRLPIIAFAAIAACTVPDYRNIPAPRPAPAPIPVPQPQVNPLSAKARFIDAVAANGCTFNQQSAPVVMANATLSREDLARILQELRDEGSLDVLPGEGFRVRSGACA